MFRNFFSWLQFPLKLPEIQKQELEIIIEVLNELGLAHRSIELDLNMSHKDNLQTYSYFISEDDYKEILADEKKDIFFIHHVSKPIFITYNFALCNFIRFFPEKNTLSFDEIKGLNSMDKIVVLTLEDAAFLEKNHIDKEKIIFLPFPKENSLQSYKDNLKILIKSCYEEAGKFRKYLVNLNLMNQEIYHDLSSTIKLRQVSEQVKRAFDKEHLNFNVDEVTCDNLFNFGPIFEKSSFYPFKTFNSKFETMFSDEAEIRCLFLIQVLENLTDEELLEFIQKMVEKYSFIVISCKSEFYLHNNYRTKVDFIRILEKFELIQESYYGSFETKLGEKELFIVIIKGKNTIKKNLNYITWEGSQFFYNSLAVINRELEIKLIESADYELAILPKDYYKEVSFENYPFYNVLKSQFNKILLYKNDFYIRHTIPANFSSPEDGYYIIIIPWEFGTLQKSLLEHINRDVDEIWCPSNYVKNLHLESGVIEDKIKVIPNGINHEIFNPLVKPLKLNTKKSFRFLFLGGMIYRKGIDILLQAYAEEFSENEDVSLVIKGLGQNTYYDSDLIANQINGFLKEPSRPELIFLEKNLSIYDMGSIYTACDCYVHPYRGEGFGMPIAEAMACALPVIVPGYGPSLDFCDNSNSYLIDYQLKTEFDSIDFKQKIICIESDKEHLKKLMRHVFENRDEAKMKGQKAHTDIFNTLGWDNIFKQIAHDLSLLRTKLIFRKNIDYYVDLLVAEIEQNLITKNNVEAKRLILTLEKIVFDRFEYLELLGNLNSKLENNTQALDYFTKLLKLKPGDKKISLKLASLLEKLGDKKTAEAIRKNQNSWGDLS